MASRLSSLILLFVFCFGCAPAPEPETDPNTIRTSELCTTSLGLQGLDECGEEAQVEELGSTRTYRASGPPTDCLHLKRRNSELPSGVYRIDPDGPGGELPFEARCDMVTDGGGWTALSGRYLATLIKTHRRYLYTLEGAWYQSPSTTQVWSWDKAQMLPGDYLYSERSLDPEGVIPCDVPELAARYAAFGVGCFLIPIDGWTIFPLGSHDPALGTTQLCQSNPGIMGTAPCPEGVQIWERRDVM
jgi:hypothetical protein